MPVTLDMCWGYFLFIYLCVIIIIFVLRRRHALHDLGFRAPSPRLFPWRLLAFYVLWLETKVKTCGLLPVVIRLGVVFIFEFLSVLDSRWGWDQAKVDLPCHPSCAHQSPTLPQHLVLQFRLHLFIGLLHPNAKGPYAYGRVFHWSFTKERDCPVQYHGEHDWRICWCGHCGIWGGQVWFMRCVAD